ncbi:hypothetical protein [Rhodovulum sulfidophilum]|uniref:hypothetical protein n=1 Tax=Rhodovulum sulfidophilum TaxID=35806 RepID=UPI001F44C117|nr:hypothetical protein [Rhodovulum sulfidophilum]
MIERDEIGGDIAQHFLRILFEEAKPTRVEQRITITEAGRINQRIKRPGLCLSKVALKRSRKGTTRELAELGIKWVEINCGKHNTRSTNSLTPIERPRPCPAVDDPISLNDRFIADNLFGRSVAGPNRRTIGVRSCGAFFLPVAR